MFDDVVVDYPLPGGLPREGWQSKSGNCQGLQYRLTEEGRLMVAEWGEGVLGPEVDTAWLGEFRFYHEINGVWHEFGCWFVDGKVADMLKFPARE